MALKLHATIIGSPLSADADPNTTPPAERRIIKTPMSNGYANGGLLTALMFLHDGTTADVEVFVRVPGLGDGDGWHSLNPTPVTVTANQVQSVSNIPADADVFFQLTNVVGNPTELGIMLAVA